MGATVFDAARVKTRKTSDGQIAYLWEEKTHCIKEGPKFSEWCAMGFGTRADMLRRIYGLASSIPGGMLKVGGRSVTAFVDAMLRLLDQPEALSTDAVEMENHSKGFYTAIDNKNREAVRAYLDRIGREDLAMKIGEPQEKATKVAFSLDNDFDAVRGIINDIEYDGESINGHAERRKGISVWRAFPHCGSSAIPGPSDEPFVDPKIPATEIKLYRTNINIAYSGTDTPSLVHVATINGSLVYVGTLDYNHYQLTALLVQYAGDVHARTGHNVLRPVLKALEKSIQDPIEIPGTAVFTFENKGMSWTKENFQKVRNVLGKPEDDAFTASAMELSQISEQPFNELRYLVEAGQNQRLVRIEGLEATLL